MPLIGGPTSFRLQIEGDFILLESGADWLIEEDGATNVLQETGPAYLDLTPYILYNGIALKFNTLDVMLIDPPAFSCHLTEDLVAANPAWTGNVVAIETSDPTEELGHQMLRLTGTNTKALPTDTAPFDLSESPTNGTFRYLLEDGASNLVLEDGTDFAPGIYLIEGALSYAYRGLTVRSQVNATGPVTTLGQATVYQPGLRPGNIFGLTSTNQGYSGAKFRINQATVTWPGAVDQPWYLIEFGDTPQTLAAWTQITAPTPPVPVSAPIVIPSGPVIYGKAAAGYALWPMGGGIVTIASANFSISAPAGHSLTVQLVGQIDCRAFAWDNYIATPRRAVRAVISGGIYTGAWQETPAGTVTTAGARAIYDLSSALGISLPDGTYTVSIQIDTQESNQMEVFSAYAQAAVTTV